MKNVTKIFLITILALMSVGAGAQNYGYQYSGYSQRGDVYMPYGVARAVNLYPDFVWVGTTQVQRGHRHLFIVTLRRGNRFLELTINQRGEIISRNRYVRHIQVISYPYSYGYTYKKAGYHSGGNVYSRRVDNNHYDYPWNDHWKKEKKWNNDRDDDHNSGRRNK